MGDRTTTIHPCPKCKKQMETYDAPSCLQHVSTCDHCGWTDGLDYYEDGRNTLWLVTEEEARKRGLWLDCPKCKKGMSKWENDKYGMCMWCAEKR